MKKTVAYIRQSLNENKQKYSLDMQKGYCLDYASKKEWVLHDIYNEGSRSARKTAKEARPVLASLLEEIKAGNVVRVLVFKRDRLARNVQQYIEILREFKKYDVELHFTADDEPQLFTGAISEFIEVLLAGIAKHEGDNIVSRLIQAKIQKIKEGKWAAGKPPFGYRLEGGEEKGILVVDTTKEDYIIKVFDKFIEVALATYKPTIKSIVKEMKKDSYFEKLTSTSLWKTISQPLYKGELIQRLDGNTYDPVFNKKWIIVNQPVWDEANTILATMEPPKSVLKKDDDVDDVVPLLSGLLVCTKCKKKLKTCPKNYKCPNKDCKKMFNIENFDEKVLDRLVTSLKKKGLSEWDKVCHLLDKKYAKPFKKFADQTMKELRQLEKEIKDFLKASAVNADKEILLKALVQKYKEKTIEYERALSSYHFISSFISELDKEEELATFTIDDLTPLQRQLIVKLVSEITVGNEIESISLYTVG